jgi:hypothetical protein
MAIGKSFGPMAMSATARINAISPQDNPNMTVC